MKTSSIIRGAALAMAIFPAALQPCVAQTTWNVTSTGDDATDTTTLRGALAASADGDTIQITATGTIYLDNDADTGQGALSVNKSVTINGPGQELLTLDGNHDPATPGSGGPVFWVGIGLTGPIPGLQATISGMTIAHGYFDQGGGAVFNLSGLTITDCTLTGNYGAIGGAIINVGALTLSGCTLSENQAMVGGGAIYNGFPTIVETFNYSPELTISGCTLSDNQVTGTGLAWTSLFYGGGAICNTAYGNSASMAIVNSLLSGNSAGGYFYQGGAISIWSRDDDGKPASSVVSITESTLDGNAAASDPETYPDGFGAYGGAIAIFAESVYSEPDDAASLLTIDSCTLSGNLAYADGAMSGAIDIYGFGGHSENFLMNSTLSGNLAAGTIGGRNGAITSTGADLSVDNCTFRDNADEGVISGIQTAYMSTTVIKNTILANSSTGLNLDNAIGTVVSAGHNLSTDDGKDYDGTLLLNDPSDMLNTDPMLDPLADNGGPTWTHALQSGSPAIDTADSTDSAGYAVTVDQRGITRPQGETNDIGAYEAEIAPPASVLDVSEAVVRSPSSKSPNITVRVFISNPNETTAYDVNVTSARLDGVDTKSALPLVYGAIKPGTSKQCTLQFKAPEKGIQTLTVNGTSSLGDFLTVQSVEVP